MQITTAEKRGAFSGFFSGFCARCLIGTFRLSGLSVPSWLNVLMPLALPSFYLSMLWKALAAHVAPTWHRMKAPRHAPLKPARSPWLAACPNSIWAHSPSGLRAVQVLFFCRGLLHLPFKLRYCPALAPSPGSFNCSIANSAARPLTTSHHFLNFVVHIPKPARAIINRRTST